MSVIVLGSEVVVGDQVRVLRLTSNKTRSTRVHFLIRITASKLSCFLLPPLTACMPLDSQTYLRNNGWQGHGTALREGALARPLSIPQKRTLAGVGKDRDEAFPFWDQ